jgi:hypothetical protein
MTHDHRRVLWQTPPPEPEVPSPEPNIITLPFAVDEAAFFDAGPGTVVFDLTATSIVTDQAVRGLIRAAREGEVRLRLRDGLVMRRLKRLFGAGLVPDPETED